MWDWFTGIRHFELCNRVSFNNEKHCREISEHKIAVCEKTAGLRSGNSTDLDSASLKVFQFQDMHNETERYRGTTHGLYNTQFTRRKESVYR